MKIDKFWKDLKCIPNGDYVLEGDLISEETIEIDLDDRFVIKGKIESKKNIIVRRGINAGWGINAGCGINAGEGINAGLGINAGCGINAGWGIKAKTFIDCKKRIFAGLSVYHTNKNCTKTIECAELKNGEICFGDLVIVKPEAEKSDNE